ncbi:uncharacterized protein FOMMEDRAFT_166461 [Fomitiporia mediterranea MF3/22]|uniref:uncharacterized protein n=1 Tax=Fomitiporia mediterranea (strain MF3/22) TaxID=694068 RepID=UPI0004408757|nr:uncharacterized protein FOMMEDRAFT_166461 [Fomitiporia mediterranea MF3/22]EJD06213.1 hypothetical protein FOMMEDRAFT_166461 [Fomitiporia mediterranea MF3/22]
MTSMTPHQKEGDFYEKAVVGFSASEVNRTGGSAEAKGLLRMSEFESHIQTQNGRRQLTAQHGAGF